MQNNMNMKLNHYMGVIACISLLLLGSCNSEYSESRNFDDIIFQIENDPQSYLLKLDTINMNCVKNKRDAVHFILAAITLSIRIIIIIHQRVCWKGAFRFLRKKK